MAPAFAPCGSGLARETSTTAGRSSKVTYAVKTSLGNEGTRLARGNEATTT